MGKNKKKKQKLEIIALCVSIVGTIISTVLAILSYFK